MLPLWVFRLCNLQVWQYDARFSNATRLLICFDVRQTRLLSYLIFYGPGQPLESPKHLGWVCPCGGTYLGRSVGLGNLQVWQYYARFANATRLLQTRFLSYLIFFGPGQPREAPEHLCHVCPHGGTSSGWFWGGPALWVDPQVQLCAKGARL